MTEVKAVISDFGGVLTSPLVASFEAFRERSGVSLEALGEALAALTESFGSNPLFELETGRLTEAAFLDALSVQLTAQLERPVALDDFGELYFAALTPNRPFIEYMRDLRARGHRLAICTNNVREWSQRWRAMVPVDEVFDVVVDSSAVGARKPEPRIYELTLAELGVQPASAVMIDDLQINCEGARQLGMRAVWFQSTEQAMADVDAALRDGG